PKMVQSAPMNAAMSSSPGPRLGASQSSEASRNPVPNHQPRTAASLADGAERNSSMPGTSPNHATNSRFGAGKASAGSAPATSAAYRAGLVNTRQNATFSIVRPAPRSRIRSPPSRPPGAA